MTDYSRSPPVRCRLMNSFLDKTWGIKSAVVREGFYNDMVELYSRTGIVPDELINTVVRFVQETRKDRFKVTKHRHRHRRYYETGPSRGKPTRSSNSLR